MSTSTGDVQDDHGNNAYRHGPHVGVSDQLELAPENRGPHQDHEQGYQVGPCVHHLIVQLKHRKTQVMAIQQ